MSDLIDRRAAIDAFKTNINELVMTGKENAYAVERYLNSVVDEIKQLPPIQPEIVRCKDCRYYNSEEKECLDLMGHGRRWEEDDFCSYGAKMEVTT